MKPELNPLDQFIAARVKDRFASSTKVADVNDYPAAYIATKSADAAIAGLITTSKRYESAAKSALADLAKAVDGIPAGLEKLGVSPKGLQRYQTQAVNLIKAAQKGHPLRAYSTYKSDAPISKLQKVLVTLGSAALKSSGVGTKILKPVMVQHLFKTDVAPSLDALKSACDDWYESASNASHEIERSISAGGWLAAEPTRSGFGPDPEWEKYAKAQREFAKEAHDLADIVRHNAIGLPLAASSFEDCVDVDVCLKTMGKACTDLLKLHEKFGKEWGDFRSKLQDKETTGQRSLFARSEG